MEISSVPRRGDCLYFTRFTVDSEGSYYPASPKLVARFLAEAEQVLEVAAIAEFFRERLGIEAFAEIRRGPHVEDEFLSKTVQGLFFVMLAYYLERAYPRPIRAWNQLRRAMVTHIAAAELGAESGFHGFSTDGIFVYTDRSIADPPPRW